MIVKYEKYAQLCNLKSVQAIYARVESGKLKPVVYDNPDGSKSHYIDTEVYPPQRNKEGQGRKKNK